MRKAFLACFFLFIFCNVKPSGGLFEGNRKCFSIRTLGALAITTMIVNGITISMVGISGAKADYEVLLYANFIPSTAAVMYEAVKLICRTCCEKNDNHKSVINV